MNRIKVVVMVVALTFVAVGVLLANLSQAAGENRIGQIPVTQIIVQYKDHESSFAGPNLADEMERLSQAAGVELAYFRPMSGDAHVLRLPQAMPESDVAAIADKLAALPDVAYAEPDAIMFPMITPDDPEYLNQWHYANPAEDHYGINAPAAWDVTTGSTGIFVAVLDTGITNHPDLLGRWTGGYDFISNPTAGNDSDGRDSDPHDTGDWVTANECGYTHAAHDSSWHGTHVAGTVGAATNNALGVAGINWVSPILPVRVLGKCGGTTSDIADAMRWAAGIPVAGVPNNGTPAKVINMSLGGYGACGDTYQSAINDVVSAGSTLVISAGNSNDDSSLYRPGNCNGVITVAASDRNGQRASYSNYGAVVEIAGPGGDQSYANDPDGVLSTLNDGATTPANPNYEYYQGTSMAAPHVAGVASLLLSQNPNLTPAQVTQILQATVTQFPAGSSCTTAICGAGIVNAFRAVSPLIMSVAPGSVALDSGPVVVTINGANFNTTTTVYINNQARQTTVDNSGRVTTSLNYTDTHVAGSLTVYVQGDYGAAGILTSDSKTISVGQGSVVNLPLVVRPLPPTSTPPPNAGITPGYWFAGGAELYVTPDQAYVDNFAIYFSVDGCGSYQLIHKNPEEPISNNQFSFVGNFYGNGTFNSSITASGQTGLINFIIPKCGTVSGGPWNYSAVWQDATQPAPDFWEAFLIAPYMGEAQENDSYTIEYLGP